MAISPNSNALYVVGRRVERLLFGGIALVAFCFVEAYLATAYSQLVVDRSANVVIALLGRLESEEQQLNVLFQTKEEAQQPRATKGISCDKRRQVAETRKQLGLPAAVVPPENAQKLPTYTDKLDAISTEISKGSYLSAQEIRKHLDATKPPGDLIKALRKQKEILDNQPTTVWGIQAPRLIQVQYAGADYKVPYGVLSGTLAVVLSLLAIGWLGALYMTRQRELSMIATIQDYKLAFPHVLNLLPVNFSKIESQINPSRRAKRRDIFHKFNRIALAVSRVCVILLFAIPLIIGFAYSLAQLWQRESDSTFYLFSAGGFLLCIMFVQAIVLCAQEWMLLSGKEFFE